VFGIGWTEVAVISVVAIAVFGSKKIPELGRSMGQAIRGFRDEIKSGDSSDTPSDHPQEPPKQ
jgi:sec-independent protein translocase protein TatA